ncbi:vWA domain-containing protein [Hyphomicrobium sp. D-2]|uniref:vWA domain-containing protein n=1 Tax=Hyphomicrobium sp. D-2 TaxID=3041621 RepID=UPI002454CA70|nr:vWA domain-containing protein [Hyphomicrobium sp. D-2]MDH4981966.1 VWA domain-containing protein [Hyphomicrobium sp. D-2]
MNLALTYPWVLALIPLALLPLTFAIQRRQGYPSLAGVEPDGLSRAVDIGLHLLGALAILSLLAAIGGLHLKGQTVERVGEGSHVVLLLDRSSSMDETFAGKQATETEASKSSVARELMREFINRRDHDRFGVAAFSTMAMPVLPITSHKDAVLGAVDAITRPGLAYTNVGQGLALALSMHEADPTAASRAILLVSDGAAVIDRRVQERLREQIAKRPVNLYWLYLRTAGAPGIFDPPREGVPDTPQAMPERHLNLFFQSLKVPYRAFEAENPEAIADAIEEIDKLERNPIRYQERIPEIDLSDLAYGIAAGTLLLLLLAKLAEVRLETGGALTRSKAGSTVAAARQATDNETKRLKEAA